MVEGYERENKLNASSDKSLNIDDHVEDENQSSPGEVEESVSSGEDQEDVKNYPNIRRSLRTSHPPEIFDSRLFTQCLLGIEDDHLCVFDALSTN